METKVNRFFTIIIIGLLLTVSGFSQKVLVSNDGTNLYWATTYPTSITNISFTGIIAGTNDTSLVAKPNGTGGVQWSVPDNVLVMAVTSTPSYAQNVVGILPFNTNQLSRGSVISFVNGAGFIVSSSGWYSVVGVLNFTHPANVARVLTSHYTNSAVANATQVMHDSSAASTASGAAFTQPIYCVAGETNQFYFVQNSNSSATYTNVAYKTVFMVRGPL